MCGSVINSGLYSTLSRVLYRMKSATGGAKTIVAGILVVQAQTLSYTLYSSHSMALRLFEKHISPNLPVNRIDP